MRIRIVVAIVLGLSLLPFANVRAATQPVLVVFPLIAQANAPADLGTTLSRVLANQVADRGDVIVKTAPPSTPQADYLATARSLNGDYYLAGFASVVGSQVSAVEQLVGTKSGVVIWRNSSTYNVPDDAKANGIQLHDAIVQFYNGQSFSAGPALAGPGAPPAAPPAPRQAPPPSAARPTPPPAPLPIPATYEPTSAPVPVDGPRMAVADFDGSAIAAVLHYVPAAVIRTLPQIGVQGIRVDLAPDEIKTSGLLICAQSGADQLLTGNVGSSLGDPERGFSYQADVELKAYDCRHIAAKPRVFDRTIFNGNLQTAIDIAISQELKDLAYQLKTGKN